MVTRICGSSHVIVAVVLALAATGGRAAAELSAADAKKFFNDKGCNACHGVDELRIGPSYKMVAVRYAADPSSERIDKLARKIVTGGAGAWGNVPMVSNPAISREEAEAVVRWIMNLQKGDAGSPLKK